MSSEPALAVPGASSTDKRLHPMSWLFTLIGQLKQFALPLLVLLFTGKHSNTDLWGLIGVAVLATWSVTQYFTYRYRIEGDGVVIRSGVLLRSARHIPFARIQNVSLHQSVLHRLFNVAEVRLESAGAAKPEGQMRVLRLDAAHELERQVSARAHSRTADHATPPSAGKLLLTLPTTEVLRLGLVNNRGILVIGGLFALLAQAGDNLLGKLFKALGEWLSGQANALHLSLLASTLAAFLLMVLLLVLLRFFSVLIALLQFHGFRLTEVDGRLSVERGLLTRLRGSLPRHRIQAFSLSEGLLHRWFHRRSLRVDSAVMEQANERRSLRDLVPIAEPALMDTLIADLLPSGAWPIDSWQPLHPRAWRRKFTTPVLLVLIMTAVAVGMRGLIGLSLLGLVPILFWRAKLWARHSAYSINDELIAFRGGWLGRHWRFAECGKVQALEWLQSPFDRRNGMATLRFDTAGAGAMEPALLIPYLPEADARRLFERLSVRLATLPTIRSKTAVSAIPAT